MRPMTMKQLEQSVNTLNEVAGRPTMAWVDGKAKVGNFHVYGAYGSYGLHCICTEGGGVTQAVGLSTKRQLNDIVRGMIAGVLIGRNM